MENQVDIKFRLGGSLEQEFCEFWNAQRGDASPVESSASFHPETKSTGGPSFALPPEVIVVLRDVGIEIAKGLLGAMAGAVGKMVWARLRKFFSSRDPEKIPKTAVILIQHQKIVFNPRNMPVDRKSVV